MVQGGPAYTCTWVTACTEDELAEGPDSETAVARAAPERFAGMDGRPEAAGRRRAHGARGPLEPLKTADPAWCNDT